MFERKAVDDLAALIFRVDAKAEVDDSPPDIAGHQVAHGKHHRVAKGLHVVKVFALRIETLVDAVAKMHEVSGQRNRSRTWRERVVSQPLRLKVAGLGEQSNYELPMTQEQLADATGLTSVHVNRTIKGLEADGLIVRRTPRFVEIGDWKKLAETGDFNSAYLHLNDGEPALAK
jgi:hypothetical protein